MSDLKLCKSCFGKYGNTMCNVIMCNASKECQECYWEGYLKMKRGEWVDLREILDKYTKKYNLKIKEFIRK
ncbi:MAG: hypothetical protein M0R17_05760 [Candidatus Omnitrophica bacterium]|jgi:hypothetical protein|nr:hypothetical protein [Candidatus Omnitrophota bacterium]